MYSCVCGGGGEGKGEGTPLAPLRKVPVGCQLTHLNGTPLLYMEVRGHTPQDKHKGLPLGQHRSSQQPSVLHVSPPLLQGVGLPWLQRGAMHRYMYLVGVWNWSLSTYYCPPSLLPAPKWSSGRSSPLSPL